MPFEDATLDLTPAGKPVARFDDLRADTTLQFSSTEQHITAWTSDDVAPALRTVQQAVDDGWWAYGFVAYEAASGLTPEARTHPPRPGLPLVWFGLSRQPDDAPAWPPTGQYQVDGWTPDWAENEHADRVALVQEAIARGESYQCNLTTHMRGRVTGDLLAYYRDLIRNQQGAFNAYLDVGPWAILSASPECFFQRSGATIRSVPMKGTARRRPFPPDDEAARADLLGSAKDRAENVMIVDLIRNDLNRLAKPGTVHVSSLLAAEKYPTVWQLTSTVEAELDPEVALPEIFQALFPCGSITGAPKLSTMDLITELETAPRGIYCGAIGYLSPAGQASFGVAIRTLTVDRRDGAASYGVGGGITWPSVANDEYQELLAKARVLRPAPVFELFETFALHDGEAPNLAEHLDRLAISTAYFDFACDRAAIESAVANLHGTQAVRLRLSRTGEFRLEPRELPTPPSTPVRLAIDTTPIDPESPFIHHKTTFRDHYAAARKRHPEADDTILINPAGQVTETTVANLAVRLGEYWFTPPLTDGCLPGIGRRLALADGRVRERSLSVHDVLAADEVALVSSVRGWRAGALIR